MMTSLSRDDLHVYGSSLRAAPVSTTLRHAEDLGSRLGVTRVTDITRLDRIGMPVCASIRPGAMSGSLCVNAGKGVTVAEARAGAWMEAIEFALAEPGASPVPVAVLASARAVLDGPTRPDAILDLCPHRGVHIDLDAPMSCIVAEELLSRTLCLVPAELVFLPEGRRHKGESWHFGVTSNGLASGNTVLEATVHGLAEVIERDITAFHQVRDTSILVRESSLPMPAAALADRCRQVGLRLYVRYHPNAFDIPFFSATLADPEAGGGGEAEDAAWSLFYINGGFGCHPHRGIALMRAVCEAAQSRLSFIHGGRDDLDQWQERYAGWEGSRRAAYARRHLDIAATEAGGVRDFEELGDRSEEARDLPAAFACLVRALNRVGLDRVCRVAYTRPDEPIQVVRILVPGLECYDNFCHRVGKRLRDYVIHVSRS